MTAAIALLGLGFTAWGVIPVPDADGKHTPLDLNIAGCGMAAFLGAACGAVL